MQHANNENHAAGGAQVLDSMQRRVIKGYELALAVSHSFPAQCLPPAELKIRVEAVQQA